MYHPTYSTREADPLDACILTYCKTRTQVASYVVYNVASFALFVISCMAIAGTFRHSPAILGRTMIGLGATTLIALVIQQSKSRSKATLVNTICMAILYSGIITAGALGCTHLLTMRQIGQISLSLLLGGGPLAAVIPGCYNMANGIRESDTY